MATRCGRPPRRLPLHEHSRRLIIATGRYLGEGFDDPRLDTLFLTMPISWKGTLAQYAGRLHRLHDHKTEVVIYDCVDGETPMTMRMFRRRLRGYHAIGYRVDGFDEMPLPEASCGTSDFAKTSPENSQGVA
jgi:superfamily II DNA or RNA helicase